MANLVTADEEVIKRRLLIDGDGTGQDRKINILLKNYIKWINISDTEDMKSNFYRLQAQLAICSLNAKKSEYAYKMIQNELKNYEHLSGSIEKSIDGVKDNIESLKQEFALAKRIRKNRMEYDVLAKSIMAQPDRKETTKQLETLKMELKDLEDESNKLQRKIKSRQNDFFVLMRSIKELDSKLSSDDDSSSDSSSSDSDDNEGNMSIDDIMEIPLSPMKE